MERLSTLDWVAMVLVLVGGLNWGLVGIFDYNLVTSIFGDATWWTAAVYDLVGLSALYLVFVVSRLGRRAAAV